MEEGRLLRETRRDEFEMKRAVAISLVLQPRMQLPIKSFSRLKRDIERIGRSMIPARQKRAIRDLSKDETGQFDRPTDRVEEARTSKTRFPPSKMP